MLSRPVIFVMDRATGVAPALEHAVARTDSIVTSVPLIVHKVVTGVLHFMLEWQFVMMAGMGAAQLDVGIKINCLSG